MPTNLRILLVEDDHDLRESVEECLSLAGYNIRGVSSGMECYRALGESTFNIAIIDLGLPDQDGFILANYIRKNTAMKVIILTARSSVEDRVRGYDAGADLYLVKPVDFRELTAAINSLGERILPALDPRVSTPERWQLVRDSWQIVAPDGVIISLTGKELHFVETLLVNHGKPVKRETIIEQLGYGDVEYASRAMDSLVRRLRRKIESSTRCEPPIRTVHAIGYCFSAPVIIS